MLDVHLILLLRLSEGEKVVDEETEPMLVGRRKLKTMCLTFGVSGMHSVYFCTDVICHTVVDCEGRVVATGLRQRLLETTGLHLSFRQNFSLFVVWNAMGNTESREASFWSTANIYPNNFHCNVSSCLCKMWKLGSVTQLIYFWRLEVHHCTSEPNLFINLSSACFTWMSNFHPHIHQVTACIQNVAHSRLAVVGRCIAWKVEEDDIVAQKLD